VLGEVEGRHGEREHHERHQRPGDLGCVALHQADDQEGGDPDRHRVEVGAGDGLDQGDDLDEVALGAHGAGHDVLDPFGRRQHARRGVAHVGGGEDLAHLVGEHLDAEAGDEPRHHGAGEEVGEERQPEDPEDEEEQRADHGQRQGVLQAHRVAGRGEGDKGGADQGGHGGVGAGHQVTRAREQGEDHQRDDGGVQAGRRGQAGDLRVADVERDHQGGQGDARRGLARDVGQGHATQPRERAGPADPGEHAGCSLAHGVTPSSRGLRRPAALRPPRRPSPCPDRGEGDARDA
jgi:hypothetical protein